MCLKGNRSVYRMKSDVHLPSISSDTGVRRISPVNSQDVFLASIPDVPSNTYEEKESTRKETEFRSGTLSRPRVLLVSYGCQLCIKVMVERKNNEKERKFEDFWSSYNS